MSDTVEDQVRKKLAMEERMKHYQFWFNFDVFVVIVSVVGVFTIGDLPVLGILSIAVLAVALFAASQNHKRAEKIRANIFAGKLTLD